jgi:uncharacterized membrane protein YagU involved in acid resistance
VDRNTSFVRDAFRTGIFVALSDGLFASLTGLIPPHATPFRIFRGVASVLLGKAALTGGTATALIGIAMHFGVALFWSTLFVLALQNSAGLRAAIQKWPAALLVAAVYGPVIWVIMSLVVIPAMVHRPPTINFKWWIQFIGHIPFVAGPMILVNRNRTPESIQ